MIQERAGDDAVYTIWNLLRTNYFKLESHYFVNDRHIILF